MYNHSAQNRPSVKGGIHLQLCIHTHQVRNWPLWLNSWLCEYKQCRLISGAWSFPCTQHQGQYLHVFVQLAPGAACLSLGWEPAESWSSSGESSAAPDTAEMLQEEILPLGYWNFIIPDQTDDLKDLVQDNYISGGKKKKLRASTRGWEDHGKRS